MSQITAGEAASQLVLGVRFTKIGKLYHFLPADGQPVQTGDYLVVETQRGLQMGQVMGMTVAQAGHSYESIVRLATQDDLSQRAIWEARQGDALDVCQQQADRLRRYRDVKFVAAQYSFDGAVLTFLYSIEDGRVDIHALQQALNREFDARIYLHQIGPRDAARLLGGRGACGIEQCCSTFLTDFSPVSIKMAKAQGIPLNPSDITGMCGRLRCCLVYEYEQYVQARKQLPKRNKRIGTPLGIGRVTDVHPLADAVTVRLEDSGERERIERADIVPLAELEALAKAAKSPCSKHR